MSKQEIAKYLSRIGKKGGKARLKTMTKEERSASAKKAINARWAKEKA
jgi:hypothetical protein